jgi:hypothetical protein
VDVAIAPGVASCTPPDDPVLGLHAEIPAPMAPRASELISNLVFFKEGPYCCEKAHKLSVAVTRTNRSWFTR